MSDKTSIKLVNNILNLAGSDDDTGLVRALAACKVFADSGAFPVKTPEEVLSALILADSMGLNPMEGLMLSKKLNEDAIYSVIRGRELGLAPLAALENIHTYKQGGQVKTIIGIHAMVNVLLANGIKYQIIENYQRLNVFADSKKNQYLEEDVKVFTYNAMTGEYDYVLNPKFVIYIEGVTDVSTLPKDKLVIFDTGKEYNRRSIVIGHRLFKDGDKMYCSSSYTLAQAGTAELLDKDNWKKFPKDMLLARTMGAFSRYIADDLIHGSYIQGELINDSGDIIDVVHVDVTPKD